MKRKKYFLLVTILILTFGTQSHGKNLISSISQLNTPEYIIGTDGSGSMLEATEQAFPNAKLSYFNDKLSGYTALLNEKIDAYVMNDYEVEYDFRNQEVKGLTVLPGFLSTDVKIVAGLSKTSKIPNLEEKFNSFISRCQIDGTIDRMLKRWVYEDNPEIPEIKVPKKSKTHLTVGTTGLVIPFSYYFGNKITGFDVELAQRFAASIGAKLEIKVYSFPGLLMATATGEIDVALSNLYDPDDSTGSLNFSQAIYTVKPVVVIREDSFVSEVVNNLKLSDFEGKKIGLLIGSDSAKAIEEKIPGVKISFFDSPSHILPSLRSHKIDAFYCALPTAKNIIHNYDDLAYVSEPVRTTQHTTMFPSTDEGRRLCKEYSDFLKSLQENGTMNNLIEKWIESTDESKQVTEDYSHLPSTNGTLTMAVTEGLMPFVFDKDNRMQGLDIDLAVLFCKSKGCGLKIDITNHNGVLSSLQTSKCDFTYSVQWTEERAKTVLFSSVPNAITDSVLVILNPSIPESGKPNETSSFFSDIASSFEKTFLKEQRWRLFADGILNTMTITILSIFFGIILGFTAFMFCRTGSKIANVITKFSVWLIKGTPNVVLLMILYYIVFGHVNISGLVVSTIAFTLTFGTSVYRMLTFGTGAVDSGQAEAAYALGFTDLQTFFTVILPQAALHFMPSFREEVTLLIKSTSIVGYIAVQDLTKMGDIVRSRTYEAFFPLIAVALIYFVLAGILNSVVTVIQTRITPSKRKPENILRGIKL